MNRVVFFILALAFMACSESNKIDRKALVLRNNIKHSAIDSLNSLTVGNGDFAFTVDITGLQSFAESYSGGISLGTMSNWGWHSYPNKNNYTSKDVLKPFAVNGKTVNYVHRYSSDEDTLKGNASEWLRENPHRIHLGVLGVEILKKDSSIATLKDIDNPNQELNLWTGEITSYFEVEGNPVAIKTVCHPEKDIVSAKIESKLLNENRIKIKIQFPAPSNKWKNEYVFTNEEEHKTDILEQKAERSDFRRKMDDDIYFVTMLHSSALLQHAAPHLYYLKPENHSNAFEFSCEYALESSENIPVFAEVEKQSADKSADYWNKGGIIDFSECLDERASELERRVILSQYLTRVNCSGKLPPQETGLTMNSWYGKFHLEMHWWHCAHFALFQRPELLENQMQYYFDIINVAKGNADFQGYKGARWPKMVGPKGKDSPSTIATYLVWQQPHPIWYSEALYQTKDNKSDILKKYKPIVYSTADFMASFALLDSSTGKYILPPPLIPAQERFKPATTVNPSFELVYWYWGLKKAIEWAQRLGEEPDNDWVNVLNNLSPIAVMDSLYLFTGDAIDSYTNERYLTDHPMILGCLGMLPQTPLIDKKIMGNTFDAVMKKWHWEETWGWDFPLTAMAAAELGRGEEAIDALFMNIQTNTFLLNGHNYQEARLPVYLPGNGSLLMSVAKMCVKNQFPKNGNWNVKWENISDF